MNKLHKQRAVLLLLATDVIARAIGRTGGKNTAAIVNNQDVQANADNIAALALNKQLKTQGKA